MEIRLATLVDLTSYFEFARAAQDWLQNQGLEQYVPPAHAEYADSFRDQISAATVYAVDEGGKAIGFFCLSPTRAQWWPPDGVAALYLAGMVVDRAARGRRIGTFIIEWCVREAIYQNCRSLRLDCHAGNPWLRTYYESHGFLLRGIITHRPGYDGCLYELAVRDDRSGSSVFTSDSK